MRRALAKDRIVLRQVQVRPRRPNLLRGCLYNRNAAVRWLSHVSFRWNVPQLSALITPCLERSLSGIV